MSKFSKSNRKKIRAAAFETLELRQLLSHTTFVPSGATAPPNPEPMPIIISAPKSSGTTTALGTPVGDAPDTPTGLKATSVSSSEIDLSWTAVDGVDGYDIQRSTDGTTYGPLDTSSLDGSSTSFQDSTASAGTKYFYEIMAQTGGTDSVASAAVNATTRPAKMTLTATPASTTAINLNWSVDTGASSYLIEKSADGGTTWTTLTNLTGTATSTSASALKADTAYKFRITPSDSGGAGATSNVVSATTQLAAPAGLKLTAISTSQINLSWTAITSSDLDSYTVQSSTDGGHTFNTIATIDPSLHAFHDTHLTTGTAYSYRVLAVNDGGASAPSTAASTTTLLDSADVIETNAVSANEIDVDWHDNDTPTALTGWTLQDSPDQGVTWVMVTTTKPAVTSFKVTKLLPDTDYLFRVAEVDAGGTSSPGEFTDTATAPLPVAGFKAVTVSKGEIDLSWTPSTISDYATYEIDRSLDGKSFNILDINDLDETDSSFADKTADTGTKYFYRIEVANHFAASASSTVASATTLADKPAGLAGTIVSASEIDLSWTAESDASVTALKLEESADGGTTWKTLASPKATATTFNATGLIADHAYKFRLSAVNPGGTSAATDPITKTTILSSPAGLKAIAASKTEIDLSWTAETHATTYKVEESTNGTGWTDISPTSDNALTGSDTDLAVTSLTAGTSYQFRISGTDASGTSAASKGVTTSTLLAAPTGLHAAASSPTAVALTWTADSDSGLTGIKVEETADGSTWKTLAIAKPTVTSFNVTGLKADTLYGFRISAINAGGTSTAAATTAVTLLLPPAGLKAAPAGPTEIDLSWTAVTDATGFVIERSTDGKTFSALDTSDMDGSETSFADTTAMANTKYFYHVAAVDDAGTSAFTAAVNATSLLTPPASLAGTVVSVSEIDLSWTAMSATGLTGFRIEVSADNGTTYKTVGTAKATATTFNVTGLSADTSYKFRVSALSAAGASPSTLTKKTLLSAPIHLEIDQIRDTRIDLDWAARTHATGYEVEGSTDGGKTWSDMTPDDQGTSTSATIDNLTPGTAYKFRVDAINAVGTSAPSAVVSAMTLLDAPSDMAATVISATQIKLHWTDLSSPNVSGYEILENTQGNQPQVIAFVDASTSTFYDTHLTTGTKYFYEIIAVNTAGGASDASNSINATTT